MILTDYYKFHLDEVARMLAYQIVFKGDNETARFDTPEQAAYCFQRIRFHIDQIMAKQWNPPDRDTDEKESK